MNHSDIVIKVNKDMIVGNVIEQVILIDNSIGETIR